MNPAAGFIYKLAFFGRGFPPQACRGASKKKTKTSFVIFLLVGKRKTGSVLLREAATAQERKTNSVKYQ